MFRYRCPICKNKLDIRKLYNSGCFISCKDCKTFYLSKERNDDEAYLDYLEQSDRGLLKKNVNINRILENEGIINSKKQL